MGLTLGKLNKSLYGLRDAPQIWKRTLGRELMRMGLEECPSVPGVWRNLTSKLTMAVHVDDLIMVAPPRQLDRLVTELRQHFELKVEKLQPGGRISYLKRTVAWTDGGIEWSPNKVHLEKLRLAMKLDGPRVNGPMTPMDK